MEGKGEGGEGERRGGGGVVETGWGIRVSVVGWCYQRILFLGPEEEKVREEGKKRKAEISCLILFLTANVLSSEGFFFSADRSVQLSSETPSVCPHDAPLQFPQSAASLLHSADLQP